MAGCLVSLSHSPLFLTAAAAAIPVEVVETGYPDD